jgi:two-component system response regulator (stage 0 sporulation protein A)
MTEYAKNELFDASFLIYYNRMDSYLNENTDFNIHKYLLSVGFRPNKAGYGMLADLLKTALSGNEITPLNQSGYLMLAATYKKNVAAVEKDIQNAISEAWLRGNIDELYRTFGETIAPERGKPTNKQFILTSLEHLKIMGRFDTD